MKVFISWSGIKSQKAAEVLKKWIPCVIQSVEPYFSSADIDKGARWSTDIAKELQDASFGILCVTNDNLTSSWLNFEAGALSKSIEQSRVCPFLVDLKPSDIQDSPILQFQMANSTKEDILKLFESLNQNLGEEKLTETILDTTFNTFWPSIEKDLNEVSNFSQSASSQKNNSKELQAPIEEILELVRYQYKLLKSPQDLIPPEYLYSIFRDSYDNYSRIILPEIESQLHEIDMLLSDISSKSKSFYIAGIENTLKPDIVYVNENQFNELQEITRRLIMMISRRKKRNTGFGYKPLSFPNS